MSLMIVPLAAADLTDTLGNVGTKIISLGSLGFLGLSDSAAVIGLTRILIWILVFTLIYVLLKGLGSKKDAQMGVLSFFNNSQAMVVAAVLATIAAIFLPGTVLAATGTSWALVIAFILIWLPIVGIAFLLWKIPWDGDDTKFTVFLKFILCLVLFWVLTAMKYHVQAMGVS